VRHAAVAVPRSRNTDVHDVDLDSPRLAAVVQRMLARAEAVDGPRGRDYLAERIKVVKDRWATKKTGPVRLGYARPAASTSSRSQGFSRPPGTARGGT
jgi:hypothetical protein